MAAGKIYFPNLKRSVPRQAVPRAKTEKWPQCRGYQGFHKAIGLVFTTERFWVERECTLIPMFVLQGQFP